MKKITNGWRILLAVAVIAVFCAAAFAASMPNGKFANGATKKTSELKDPGTSNFSFFGGSENANVKSTNLTHDADGAMFIYGGGAAMAGDSESKTAHVEGDATLHLSGGTYEQEVYGGALASTGYTESTAQASVGGNVRIKFDGTSATPAAGWITGGGYAYGGRSQSRVGGNVSIEIQKGNFIVGSHNLINGGGEAMGNDYDARATALVQGNTVINISGGSLGAPESGGAPGGTLICGGGKAYSFAIVNVVGSSAINITGGKFNKVVVYGGGMTYMGADNSEAKIGGGTTITLSGSLALEAAAGILALNGGGCDPMKIENGSSSNDVSVAGTKTLVLDSLGTGIIRSEIHEFDVVLLKGANSLTFANKLGSDVKKIKVEGNFTADTTVLTLAEGSEKPTIEGTNAKWDGLKLVAAKNSDDPAPEDPAEPAKPTFDEEVSNAISKDVDMIKPVISTNKTDTAALLSKTDITADELAVDGAGQVTLNKTVVLIPGGAYSDAYMLPIYSAAQSDGTNAKIISCAFVITGKNLLAATPAEVRLIKVKGKTSSINFTYSDQTTDFTKDGYFTIQTSDNKIAAKDAKIVETESYKVTMFIEDNKDYDLDPTDARILDPAAIVKEAGSSPSSGGGSSGCSAGLGIFALLALVPIILRNKQRK